MNVGKAQEYGISQLQATEINGKGVSLTAALDVSVLLSKLLNFSRATLMAHPEYELGERENDFLHQIEQRKQGLPIAYITGSKEFWGIDFFVSPHVHIPKPDTEILVERALQILEKKSDANKTINVLDICTGSGCIAIALKKSIPSLNVTAIDISEKALEVAKKNAKNILEIPTLGSASILFVQSDVKKDMFPIAETGWDLIVSNPPYVPTNMAKNLLNDGRSEPLLALDGGDDGLELLQIIIEKSHAVLAENGVLLLESGEYNAEQVAAYARKLNYANIIIHPDLEGQQRVTEGVKV